jgi:ATP-binding cassette subfamily B multidrug efflux pump
MFRFFETLVDPYEPYAEDDTPPNRLWPFLKPISADAPVMAWTSLSILAVAVIEIALIWYAGRLVDVLGAVPPGEVWTRHGWSWPWSRYSSCSSGPRSRRSAPRCSTSR